MARFPQQFFSGNSFIVLALVAAAAVIPHLFPLSSVSAASELLVNVAIDKVTCSVCDNCDNPCPPSLPPPPSPPVIESPPPPQLPLPPPVSSPLPGLPPPPSPLVIKSPPPPQLPLPPPVSSPPPALPPMLPPPLTEHCPPPPVPPICGECYTPPTRDIGPGTPPLPPPPSPPTTCTVCESPPSGDIVYGSPPPPTMYPGYGGGGGVYPPRPNIVTPYFPYDGPPPRTASTGRSTPLFVYFWVAALLSLHLIIM